MELPSEEARDKVLATGHWECREPRTFKDTECECPDDYFGKYCEFRHTYVCYFNVTNPPLFERCDRPDSFEYSYSLSGWEPCHTIKPHSTQNITGFLQCTIAIKN